MSCGKQVITTDYSAHTEFTNWDNAHLISIDKLEPAHDEPYFYGQGEWASIRETELKLIAKDMRMIHEQKQSGKLCVNTAGIETAKQFSWQRTAKTLMEAIYG